MWEAGRRRRSPGPEARHGCECQLQERVSADAKDGQVELAGAPALRRGVGRNRALDLRCVRTRPAFGSQKSGLSLDGLAKLAAVLVLKRRGPIELERLAPL